MSNSAQTSPTPGYTTESPPLETTVPLPSIEPRPSYTRPTQSSKHKGKGQTKSRRDDRDFTDPDVLRGIVQNIEAQHNKTNQSVEELRGALDARFVYIDAQFHLIMEMLGQQQTTKGPSPPPSSDTENDDPPVNQAPPPQIPVPVTAQTARTAAP